MGRLSLFEKRKMAIEELIKYYSEYRKIEFNNGEELKGIEFRKKIHLLIKLILKLDELMSKEKIVIINDARTKENNLPKIYACTHIGGNDIQRTFQIINAPAYLMLGDPGILYKMPIYCGLKLNGVIPLETKNKQDRRIAYNRAIELLKNGGNLLIYPEGAWNVTPNEMVMKTFTGTVRMAKETGVEIVPIAVEQYNNIFYFNIGKNYTIDKNTNVTDAELNADLRDKLATLKWEIMETQPKFDRTMISNDYLDVFQSEIVGRCNYGYGFSLEDAISESFHDKNITKFEDAFAHLDNIEFDARNAFLLGGSPKKIKRK